MKTRVVLRTDFMNYEMIYKKLPQGLEYESKSNLIKNLKGFYKALNLNNKLRKDDIKTFMVFNNIITGEILSDMPYDKVYFHDMACDEDDYVERYFCSHCGVSEHDDRYYHCRPTGLNVSDDHIYIAGIMMDALTYSKWCDKHEVKSDMASDNYRAYFICKSANYMRALQNNYDNYSDFLMTPFVLEELIKILPYLKRDDYKNLVLTSDSVKQEYENSFKFLEILLENYIKNQVMAYVLTDLDRNLYSSFALETTRKQPLIEKHSILTKRDYKDGLIEPNIAPLVKYFNSVGLETKTSCQGHYEDKSKGKAAYIVFHVDADINKIANLWKMVCERIKYTQSFNIADIFRLKTEYVIVEGRLYQMANLSIRNKKNLTEFVNRYYNQRLENESWEYVSKLFIDVLLKELEQINVDII